MRELSDQLKTTQRNTGKAAIFFDLDNLYQQVRNSLNGSTFSDAVLQISRNIEKELDGFGTQAVLRRATGKTDTFRADGNLHAELAAGDIESQVVPLHDGNGSTELQLCVNAVETSLLFPEIRLFVLVTGGRPYQPLVQHLRRRGIEVMLVSFAESNDSARRQAGASVINGFTLFENGRQAPQTAPPPVRATRFSEIHLIPDGLCRDALWVIEEFFGQYEEIYLTPLLRRLSEELPHLEDYDPKTLVSDLELAGAARLEKRKGDPYDYTVLILNEEHPDVSAIRQEYFERTDDSVSEVDEDDDVPEDEWEDDYESDNRADPGSAF